MGYKFGQQKDNYLSVEINGGKYPLKLGSHLLECFEEVEEILKTLPDIGSVEDVKTAESGLMDVIDDIFGVENATKIMESTESEPQLEDLMGLLTYIQEEFIRHGKKAKEGSAAPNREARRAAERKTRRPKKKTDLEVVE